VTKLHPQPVYLVDGARTPFSHHLRQDTKNTSSYSKLDLGVFTAQALLLKQTFTASSLDDIVIASSTTEASVETGVADLALQLSQRLRCQSTLIPHTFPAGENCAMQALQYAHQQISFGKKSLILLGGIETSTPSPITLNPTLSQWIRQWQTAKGIANKLKILNRLHTHHFQTNRSDKKQENHYQLHQEKAEKTANYFSISSAAMAEYVRLSQRRLNYAQRNKLLHNVIPIFYPDGSSLHRDEDLINMDPEALKQPIITGNPPTGIITQASVTRSTDGACMLLLANQEMVDHYHLSPLAVLSEPSWANQDDALERLLRQNALPANEVDYWEWDEISAAEVLALANKPQFAAIDAFQSLSNVNVDGGSLALGNPNTANKFRCILQLATILQRNNAKNGICHFSFTHQQSSALLLQNPRENHR
jgi:acetyl-CoA acetyltransferase